MNRLIWTQNGEDFVIRDASGYLRYPTRDELSKYATTKEIAGARHDYEGRKTPLPQFDVASGLYYWHDINDLWSEEDVIDDINKLWPGMPVEELLELARLQAKLGIVD